MRATGISKTKRKEKATKPERTEGEEKTHQCSNEKEVQSMTGCGKGERESHSPGEEPAQVAPHMGAGGSHLQATVAWEKQGGQREHVERQQQRRGAQ